MEIDWNQLRLKQIDEEINHLRFKLAEEAGAMPKINRHQKREYHARLRKLYKERRKYAG